MVMNISCHMNLKLYDNVKPNQKVVTFLGGDHIIKVHNYYKTKLQAIVIITELQVVGVFQSIVTDTIHFAIHYAGQVVIELIQDYNYRQRQDITIYTNYKLTITFYDLI